MIRSTLAALAIALTTTMAASTALAGSVKEEKFYTRLTSDVVLLTNGKLSSVGDTIPKVVKTFDEESITGGIALVHIIRDKDRKVIGFASQLEATVPDETGKKMKLDWPTTWTIIIPGRGSLVMYEIEKPTKLFAAVAEAKKSGVKARIAERTTAGPGPNGDGIIIGGTGEFEGAKGTFVETNSFDQAAPDSPVGVSGEIELHVKFEK